MYFTIRNKYFDSNDLNKVWNERIKETKKSTSCKVNKDYDSFIKKYDNYDFSIFKNTNITYRDSDGTINIYVFTNKEGNKPVYFVHFDKLKNIITSIDRSMLKKANFKDYYTDEQISTLMNDFMKYDFYILGSDNEGNVFINPYKVNSPPFFLRLKEKTGKDTIKKGFTYKRYKKNWYINTIYNTAP